MIGFRIGRHFKISDGITKVPQDVYQNGYDIFQIFLNSPKQYTINKRNESELKLFSEELEKYNLYFVVHGSYTINFCQPTNSNLFNMSLKSLINELYSADIIGKRCLGVIIHMGKNVSSNNLTVKQAMENYANGLKTTLKKTPKNTVIILETGASQGTEVGSKLEDLFKIYSLLTNEEKKRIKFCVDTCHIWASGYDISNFEKVKEYFSIFDKYFTIEKIACIHFNDSKTLLNSHVDRHADLGYGYIGNEGLKHFCQMAKKNNIPIIMETPIDEVDMSTNRDITFEDEFKKVKSWIL